MVLLRYDHLHYVAKIPIPKASANLAQKCLDAKGENCEAWEQEIDFLASALYDL